MPEKHERSTWSPKPAPGWVPEDLLLVAVIVVILLVGVSLWSSSVLRLGVD
jgi:hypothetical protein